MAGEKRGHDVASSDDDDDDEKSLAESSSTGSAASNSMAAAVKRIQLDATALSGNNAEKHNSVVCALPPHASLEFASFAQYEIHYEQNHLHRCSECSKNMPSDHYLQLHIAENHDPITAIKMERGEKIFACFVEGCDRKCSTPQKRRMHSIDKHNFPKFYDFFVVNDGIDRRTSMLLQPKGHPYRSRRKQSMPMASNERSDAQAENDVSGLVDSMSALKFVPRNLRFGQGASKAFAR